MLLWWPWRRLVIGAALAASLVLGAVSYAWVQHEASRAWHGAPVWPSPVLPFAFSARAVTLIPYGDTPPGAVSSRVLLLRDHPDSSVVYDPATREVSWVGKRIAVWTVNAGGKTLLAP